MGKKWGTQWVFRDLFFHLKPQEKKILVGPNGCGKTTLLRLLTGLLRPDEGRVTSTCEDIGLMLCDALLYPRLTVRQNLEFNSVLYGVKSQSVDEIIDALDIATTLDKTVNSLSQGARQMAEIARAAVHRPKFLLLDEPFAYLDEEKRDQLAQFLRRWDGAVLITSQSAKMFKCDSGSWSVFEVGR